MKEKVTPFCSSHLCFFLLLSAPHTKSIRNTAHRENFYYPDLWESREKAEREKQAELDLEMERSQVRFVCTGARYPRSMRPMKPAWACAIGLCRFRTAREGGRSSVEIARSIVFKTPRVDFLRYPPGGMFWSGIHGAYFVLRTPDTANAWLRCCVSSALWP